MILENIVAAKRIEVASKEQSISRSALEAYPLFNTNVFSLKDALNEKHSSGIIAEFKRKSPSRGIINNAADAGATTAGYIASGAAAVSVLTDELFFGAHAEDFSDVRRSNNCPILRKDFIISEYQVAETKAMGADVLLLIAAILTSHQAAELANYAKQIGLEVLLEVRDRSELHNISEYVDLVGVNNRNLDDFSVSINNSIELFDFIPDHFTKISESGIDSPEVLIKLKDIGYKGFLIGEKFMSTQDPHYACSKFIKDMQAHQQNKKQTQSYEN